MLGNNMFAYCRNNSVCRKDTQGTEDTESYWNDGSNGDAYNEPIDPNDMAPSTPTQAPVGQSYGSTGGGVNSSTSGVAQSNSNSQNGSSNLGQGKSASSSNLDSPVSPRKVSKGALKNVDVHSFKEVYVGKNGRSWELYKDTANNAAIWLGNKAQTNWIPTGYILEELLEYFLKGWK